MRRLFTFVCLLVVATVTGWAVPAEPTWSSGGTGTETNPYQINSAANLKAFATAVNGGTAYSGLFIKLMNDITLTTAELEATAGWTPIGTMTNPFSGSFDGDGNIISGLWINLPTTENVGFFGYTDEGSAIKKLMIQIAPQGITGQYYVGGLVGSSRSVINQCSVSEGYVTGTSCIGGLVGEMEDSITDCYVTANVTGTGASVGGLVGGINSLGGIKNCYATGEITGTGSGIGGLAGVAEDLSKYIFTSFFLQEENGINTGLPIGGLHVRSDESSSGKSLVDMKKQATFVGWDFDTIWRIAPNKNDGYPYLAIATAHLTPNDGGEGTAASPYLISSAHTLAALASFVNNGHTYADTTFVLTTDIDLAALDLPAGGAGWTPIGTMANPFEGTFDGDGHTISGLWINRPTEDFVGFFGYVLGADAEIKNLSVEIQGGVSGGKHVGGLAGILYYGSVTNCSVAGNVSGTGYCVGGLIGDYVNSRVSYNNSITNCYATGSVVGTSSLAGGLVGMSLTSAIIDSYATATVTTTGSGKNAGGLVAINSGIITNCYATGEVTATEGASAGSLAGNSNGTITASYYLTNGTQLGIYDGTGDAREFDDDLAKIQSQLTAAGSGWKFGTGETEPWAISPAINGSYPYLYWQPTFDVTMTVGDGYAYTVGGQAIDETTTFAVVQGGSFDFTYTVLDGYKGEGIVEGGAVKAGDSYTLEVTADGLAISVTGITKSEPGSDPVVTYHTLTLATGTGIVVDKDKQSFQIESGNPFSFVITLSEGYEGQTPSVTVNGRLKALVLIGVDKWRCIISEVYEDTKVEVGFNLTGNEQPDVTQLYSRDGQLFIDTPNGTTCAIYNVTGQLVANRRLAPGLTTFPLSTGIYIVRLDGATKRVFVSN